VQGFRLFSSRVFDSVYLCILRTSVKGLLKDWKDLSLLGGVPVCMRSRDSPKRPESLLPLERVHTTAPPPAIYSLLSTFFGALALMTRSRSWAWMALLFCLAAFPRIDWERSDPRQYMTLLGFNFMVLYNFDLLGAKIIVRRLRILIPFLT
jgi:hypothetical protein